MSQSSHEPQRGFETRSSIPVLRMFDEAEAKAFYLDYLGFEIDWESRFSPTAPLYMQIHLGDAILHLNGHAKKDAPISEVNIPVLGLQNYCDYLNAKGADYPEAVAVDPRYQGRNTDLNIYDPFGNHLVFCSQNDRRINTNDNEALNRSGGWARQRKSTSLAAARSAQALGRSQAPHAAIER